VTLPLALTLLDAVAEREADRLPVLVREAVADGDSELVAETLALPVEEADEEALCNANRRVGRTREGGARARAVAQMQPASYR
jgi:hypothetical protein